MSAINFRACLAFTLTAEGGWADDPRDPGGATNKGITLATFQRYDPGATVDDLRSIGDATVAGIYARGYWMPIEGDALPTGIDLSVFDFGVNAGPETSVRLLQRAVGVDDDGVLGPVSMAATRAADPSAVVNTLAHLQMAHYRGLADWPDFGNGWTARTDRRRIAALRALAQPQTGQSA
jgi:lysozyme family protein